MAKKTSDPSSTDIDMTPMIDMTFQLITFFMFVMNFSEAEQDDRIQLPLSQLAKPVDGPVEKPITLQLTNSGAVIYAGELIGLPEDQAKANVAKAAAHPARNADNGGLRPHIPVFFIILIIFWVISGLMRAGGRGGSGGGGWWWLPLLLLNSGRRDDWRGGGGWGGGGGGGFSGGGGSFGGGGSSGSW
jgi:biopolymer transport protein ExbD